MKVDFFVEDGTFYIVRTYDDDYVFLLIIFYYNRNFLNIFLKSMVLHGDFKFSVFYKIQVVGYKISYLFYSCPLRAF